MTVNFISDGTGTSGLGLTPLGSQTISVAGNAYRLASPAGAAPISFGNVHVGATVAQQALLIANAAANDGWSESLDASFGSVAAGFVSSGSVGLWPPAGAARRCRWQWSPARGAPRRQRYYQLHFGRDRH